ncbi:MAG: amidohydrolase family protein [Methylobacteriaceae bacterium]|nr:amidohydrolase family protein [Methylobacteriaceae bacterium]
MTAGAIDMHAHFYGGLVDDLMRRERRPFVSRDAQGRLVLNAMTASTVMTPGYVDIDARLSWMNGAGIAMQLLTFPGALGVDVLPIEEVAAPIADFNTGLAAICARSSGRFVGLAGLPLADIRRAAREMQRARRELRLVGAILPGNYFLSVESARSLAPVFQAADACGALLMIHPGLMCGEPPPAPPADAAVYRASVLNLQASLAHMAMTIIADGLAEAYPNIAFQIVNLGGTIPFVLERLEAVALSRPPHTPFPRRALRGMVYDCASLGPRALELAVETFGADRVMFGTDYPIFAPEPALRAIDDARLTPEQKALIRRGTAEQILDRLG